MPYKTTVEDMVGAIRDANKPLTEEEIADRVGVTRPTVSNYREDLQSHPEVSYRKAGQAMIYWHDLPEDEKNENELGYRQGFRDGIEFVVENPGKFGLSQLTAAVSNLLSTKRVK